MTLLLTYDPNVKQTPDYKVSLTSPYGNEDSMTVFREFMCGMTYLLYLNSLTLPKEKREWVDKKFADMGLKVPPGQGKRK